MDLAVRMCSRDFKKQSEALWKINLILGLYLMNAQVITYVYSMLSAFDSISTEGMQNLLHEPAPYTNKISWMPYFYYELRHDQSNYITDSPMQLMALCSTITLSIHLTPEDYIQAVPSPLQPFPVLQDHYWHNSAATC